ncbi:Os04g0564200 [Oryza sativa Japonica Group]|uniref:Os04g0564200 protein n=2 Tax=Oryza sativa subsp. japonica TaxID=39947 RepID=C7J1W3_ORYSJ|nr:Os04g0564200 [Oryza sativa Japonica Group]|eukprot:NP_001174045.1 Os04g0564200 [Oryza sativa Japonica Group]
MSAILPNHDEGQTRTPRMLCNRFCQRMEDDVHSTTSLQERAEKRKKLYQKSEEKIHAKELEQTQAKSKGEENNPATWKSVSEECAGYMREFLTDLAYCSNVEVVAREATA